uniref:Reverse transcriptase domain-containing protein n=1 Tax=Haemonchus contortus TaxID=6289 RepID=A0A7I4Y5N5_HAECO
MESFDVTSLYTNVSNNDAMQAILEQLNEYESSVNTYGLTITQVMVLIQECLECSTFRGSGQYYRQIRELAIRQRLAPVLAIAYMSKTEKPLLDRRSIMYGRYIDDCFVVCSTEEEMDTCYDLLHRQADNITFTREKPTDD